MGGVCSGARLSQGLTLGQQRDRVAGWQAAWQLICTTYHVQCTTYHELNTVYDVQCMTYSVQRTVYDVQCTSYTVRRTVYDVLYSTYICIILYILRIVRRTIYVVLYGVHCTYVCMYVPCMYVRTTYLMYVLQSTSISWSALLVIHWSTSDFEVHTHMKYLVRAYIHIHPQTQTNTQCVCLTAFWWFIIVYSESWTHMIMIYH